MAAAMLLHGGSRRRTTPVRKRRQAKRSLFTGVSHRIAALAARIAEAEALLPASATPHRAYRSGLRRRCEAGRTDR